MKFHLLENILASFDIEDKKSRIIGEKDELQAGLELQAVVPADITPVDQSCSEINNCAFLKNFLEKVIPITNGLSNSQQQDDFWSLIVSIGVSYEDRRNGCIMLPRDSPGDALSKLADLLQGISVQLDLSLLENEKKDASVLTTFSFKEMTRLHEDERLFYEPVMFPAADFFGDDEIDMEDALDLFLFARNLIPADEELIKKAENVLERYSDQLQESQDIQELFQTDYKAAIQLLQYAYQRN